MVPEMEEPDALVPLNAAIFPAPLAPNPIAVLEFVQANVVPGVKLVKLVAAMLPPSQTTMFAGTTTAGVGLIVIVYVEGVPGQPLAVGVTVIVAVIGALPVFVPLKAAMFPVPFATKPIAVFELVQLNVAPATGLVKFVAAMFTPLQTIMFAGTTTVGVGFTVIV
jgi:hypothetical protein